MNNTDTTQAGLSKFGYAPGSYYAKCLTCDQTFTGDKRATCCRPCALAKLKQPAISEATHQEQHDAGVDERCIANGTLEQRCNEALRRMNLNRQDIAAMRPSQILSVPISDQRYVAGVIQDVLSLLRSQPQQRVSEPVDVSEDDMRFTLRAAIAPVQSAHVYHVADKVMESFRTAGYRIVHGRGE